MTLGQRLKAYREKEGLTQEQFAEYLNVSRQAVTKWEHDAGVPDIENLIAISRRMGVTLDELVLGQAAPSPAAPNPAPAASRTIPAVPEVSGSDSAPNATALPHRGSSARRHAFAALAFFAACICHALAGFINLTALGTLHTPFLPLLNFGTAALSLWAAAAQARKCSRSA